MLLQQLNCLEECLSCSLWIFWKGNSHVNPTSWSIYYEKIRHYKALGSHLRSEGLNATWVIQREPALSKSVQQLFWEILRKWLHQHRTVNSARSLEFAVPHSWTRARDCLGFLFSNSPTTLLSQCNEHLWKTRLGQSTTLQILMWTCDLGAWVEM